MLIAIWPAVIMLIGLLMFLLIRTYPDGKRVGEIMFFVGLMWTVYALMGHTLHIG